MTGRPRTSHQQHPASEPWLLVRVRRPSSASKPMLGSNRFRVDFLDKDSTPYIAIRQRRPDLVVLCFAPDDDEACQVLQMLQLDPATRRLPILTYVGGEAYAIIPSEWPRRQAGFRARRTPWSAARRGNGLSAVCGLPDESRRHAGGNRLSRCNSIPFTISVSRSANARVVVKGRIAHSRISDVDQDIIMYRSGVEFIELSDRVAGRDRAFCRRTRQGTKLGRIIRHALGVRGNHLTRCAAPDRAARCRSRSTPARSRPSSSVDVGQHARVQAPLRFVRPVSFDLVERRPARRRNRSFRRSRPRRRCYPRRERRRDRSQDRTARPGCAAALEVELGRDPLPSRPVEGGHQRAVEEDVVAHAADITPA